MEVFLSIEELRSWADRLEEVQERSAPYFEQADPASGSWPLSEAY